MNDLVKRWEVPLMVMTIAVIWGLVAFGPGSWTDRIGAGLILTIAFGGLIAARIRRPASAGADLPPRA